MPSSAKLNLNEPTYLIPFLNEKGSITHKLKSQTGDAVVDVLSEQLVSLDWWCRFQLKLACDSLYRREILMYSNHFPCWYARTYIPSATWFLHQAFFTQLENKNFGDILFDNERLRRQQVDIFPVNHTHIPYHWLPNNLKAHSKSLWLKVSCFCFNDGTAFYLSELFLPELETCLQQNAHHSGD